MKIQLYFFLADNGASPEKGYKPGFDRPKHMRSGEEIQFEYERPGAENTWGYFGKAWTGAANCPFRYWKKESFEGGNCTPFIVHWPNNVKMDKNGINRSVSHVMDILPTCLELAEAEYPTTINGFKTSPPEGNSLLSVLNNGGQKGLHKFVLWL